jgi:hypothetical protein
MSFECPCRLTATRRTAHVEQELLTLSENMSSPQVFSGVRVALSLVFCVMFCNSVFVLLFFFFRPLYYLSFDIRLLQTFRKTFSSMRTGSVLVQLTTQLFT